MSLFVRKPLAQFLREAAEGGEGAGLKRVFGPWGLVALGVGVVIGAGLFSITGIVAGLHTGPAITISFVIAAGVCALAALCYAEFASMLPISGSAYSYSYATMGELVAWIIGWDLVLEYAVAAVTVSISWSGYFSMLLSQLGLPVPHALMACPSDGGVVNLPAMVIVVLLSLLLARGTKGSSRLNDAMVVLKLLVIFAFIFLGWRYIQADNLTPYVPKNTGEFGQYGISGILRGAAIVFFAYIGFDSVSTAAQETINPRRNMPIGILGSLLVSTVLYILFSHVMTGVVSYTAYQGTDGIAPVGIAISHMGPVGADGLVVPQYPWLGRAVVLAILLGYASVIMVMLMGQSRVFYAMSKDGLLPSLFSHLHRRYRTPARSQLLFMVLVSLLAGVVPSRIAGEMTSIGTLFAFALVCAGIIVMRRSQPDAPRGFRCPLVPWVPALGILSCVGMMLFLPADTWIRLVMWMLLGLDVYAGYSVRHSHLGSHTLRRHGQTLLSVLGVCLSFLCVLTGLWHQQTVGWNESLLMLILACLFGAGHIVWYVVRFTRG